MVITASQTCAALSACIDTLRSMKTTDTLITYRSKNSTFTGCQSGFAGYLTGTNCNKDKEFAQFFGPNTYSQIPFAQVNSIIVLFDSVGTKAKNPNTPVQCKLYAGSGQQGPIGWLVSKSEPLGNIVNTPRVFSVSYLGKPGQVPIGNTKIIPFKFDLNTPKDVNTISGFFAAVEMPQNSPLDSVNIYSNTKYNSAIDSSAWFLDFNNNWRTMRTHRGTKVQLAIIPQITCRPVGITEIRSELNTNVTVMPNPNTGVFNLVFTFKTEQQLNMRIMSSIGQELVDSKLNNVLNNMVSVDLSAYPDGIYFAEISNGTEKTVKKIVLTR